MIIVEGPDGVGKTTLCQKILQSWLHRKKDIRGFRRYGLLGPDFDYYWDYLNWIKPYMLVDRWTWSEMTYGPVMRGESKLPPLNRSVIARESHSMGAITIYLEGTPNYCLKHRKPGDELADEIVVGAAREYKAQFTNQHRALGRSPADHTILFTSGVDTRMENLQLIGILETYDAIQYCVRKGPPDGHGLPLSSTELQLVVIGDSINQEQKGFQRAFAKGPASEYLDKLLRDAYKDPCRCYMVNAWQPNNQPLNKHDLPNLEKLPAKMVLALGRDAEQWCFKNAVPRVYLDHPSFLRRFRSKTYNSVVDELRRKLA